MQGIFEAYFVIKRRLECFKSLEKVLKDISDILEDKRKILQRLIHKRDFQTFPENFQNKYNKLKTFKICGI